MQVACLYSADVQLGRLRPRTNAEVVLTFGGDGGTTQRLRCLVGMREHTANAIVVFLIIAGFTLACYLVLGLFGWLD